ncbi:hypothetical protein HYDPIDRAFT_87876 [Hydnomerulius pinastri MD-312]|nr:hypothetical protein HYDPIDRAFT_87876 [Hydnomerulius pinastri MD-312]
MSHLLFWRGRTFFYPIGNTSAVCLTENLPPEQKAEILLLACGDPRHILYTVYTNESGSTTVPQKLDITCCDIEVAVLARNAILFTLLADDGAQDRLGSIWNIFYHLMLDETSLSLLLAQCRKLVELAKDAETWRAGPYGHFLTVCDAATLAELRRFWNLYLGTADYTPAQAKRFKDGVLKGMKEVVERNSGSLPTTSARSAGFLAPLATGVVARQFGEFWSSGVTDDGSKRDRKAPCVNPTFAFSMAGDNFAVHYGTDPVAGFHLAEVFAAKTVPNAVSHQDIVRAARTQFNRWCTALITLLRRSNVSSPLLVIRMFGGDALSFCHALRYSKIAQITVTPINVAPWTCSRIEFDDYHYGKDAPSPAPTSFNVIDTSNVLDHVGLMNVLVVTAPLLRKSPSATLYTEGLLKSGDDPSKAILEHVCGELSTMSLLLGVVPSNFIFQYTTRSNAHEAMGHAITPEGGGQYHERLAWKAIGNHSAQHQLLSFLPDQLAALLFGVYLKMFSDENMANTLNRLSLSPALVLRDLQKSGVVHYTRRSFALFVHLVKSRVQTEWTKVMKIFEGAVQRDRNLLTGMNYFQEMFSQFVALGIFTTEWMTPRMIREALTDVNPAVFRDWRAVPQVVSVVLVVPRKKITALEAELSETGTPIFQCDIQATFRHNVFASISASFGSLEVIGKGEEKTGLIAEDRAGRFGNSPLIVSFCASSAALMLDSDATVGLILRATPRVAAKFSGKLGLDLSMFRAQLTDTRHVHVLAQRPKSSTGCSADTILLSQPVSDAIPETTACVQMDESCSKVQSFAIRTDVTDLTAKSLLAGGSAVSVEQASALEARVHIGSYEHIVSFPLPVDVSNAKLRVARKSSYIEVIAPPSSSDVKGERDIAKKFAAILEGGTPVLQNVHRINLDCCPPFKLPTHPKAFDWLDPHVSLMFSRRERAALRRQNNGDATITDTLMNLKASLHMLILFAAGVEGKPPQSLFSLFNTSTLEHYAIIWVSNLRLDLSSHNVVADAFIMPRTPLVGDKIVTVGFQMISIKTDADESKAWRHLLPLLTERCRTWTHKPSCEYLTQNCIPLPPSAGSNSQQSPICSCGAGIGTEVLQKLGRLKSIAPYATRAAISPLYSVSFLERSGISTELTLSGAKCRVCDEEDGLLVCSRCKSVAYCSKECQTRDWKSHKKECA